MRTNSGNLFRLNLSDPVTERTVETGVLLDWEVRVEKTESNLFNCGNRDSPGAAELVVGPGDRRILWKPPYQVNVTASLKPGVSQLELKVTNQWINRQIGDRRAPAEKRVPAAAGAAMAIPGRGPQTPPESGLLGPVTLISVETSNPPAAMVAEPVFRLFGKQGLGTDQWPLPGQPIMHTIGYYMHAGGHGTVPSDWDQFLSFMNQHLHGNR